MSKIRLEIFLSEKTIKKLNEQLDSYKIQAKGTNLANISTIEELVAFYMEQFVSANEQMSNFSDKMKDIYDSFLEKGIDFDSLFGDLIKKKDKEEEKEDTKNEEKEKVTTNSVKKS